MHIGHRIEEILKSQRICITDFAKEIYCSRPHVYKILKKESIDTNLLMRISKVLNHDFFMDLSVDFND